MQQFSTSTPNKFGWKAHSAWSANVYSNRQAKKLSTPFSRDARGCAG